MNKRFFISVTGYAVLALAMAGSAAAGSSLVSRDHVHGVSARNLVIEPGTDPSSVQLHFAGAERVSYVFSGTLEIMNSDGEVWRYRPQVYQVVNGRQKTVPVSFSFIGRDRVSLHVSRFDASAPLIVSPVSRTASGM
jgi:hypothetical protein